MKVTIHPLFFAVIIFCALFGGLIMTIIYVLTALLHECGHVFCAARMGYACEKIKLMPYGAAAVCDIDGISAKDEIVLALAGPAVNAALCVGVAGLWWFFPEAYAYTDTVMQANLAMLLCNLLPAYPLDGGRVARCALCALVGERVADIVQKSLSVILASCFVALFFVLAYNLTCLFFALFLLCSVFEKRTSARLIDFTSANKLKRGVRVKYVLVDRRLTFKDAAKHLSEKYYLVLQLYDDGIADEITQDELYERMSQSGIYDRVFAENEKATDETDNPLPEDYFSKKLLENTASSISPSSARVTASLPNLTPSSTAPESEA